MTPKFYATIDKGKMTLLDKPKFLAYLTSLQYKTTPAQVEITVRRYRKARSNNQNAFYWLCLNAIAHEIGEDPEELHVTFKSMFLVDRSKKLPIVRSTTSLDTKEFTDYIEKISIKVSEFGITLPDPDTWSN